jgi:hypothetical protein
LLHRIQHVVAPIRGGLAQLVQDAANLSGRSRRAQRGKPCHSIVLDRRVHPQRLVRILTVLPETVEPNTWSPESISMVAW